MPTVAGASPNINAVRPLPILSCPPIDTEYTSHKKSKSKSKPKKTT